MSIKDSCGKALPNPLRCISPEERAWLEELDRQLAYDEYMQAQRERWLWERPSKKKHEFDSIFSEAADA